MGIANAQRALGYIRIIAEFISQPEWRNVVPIFGIMNEAKISVIGVDQMTSLYGLLISSFWHDPHTNYVAICRPTI